LIVLLLLKDSGSLRFEVVQPYDFELTVHKPAGWWWSTPEEKFEDNTLWTATRMAGELLGLKLHPSEISKKPAVDCTFYSAKTLTQTKKQQLSLTLQRALRTKENLAEFYALANKDAILKQTAKDLYGMHSVGWPELFPALILAVTLQMAPLKRSDQMMDLLLHGFGEEAKFDGKKVLYWPSTKTISSTPVEELQSKAKLGYRAKNLVAIAKSLEKGFPTMDELASKESAQAKEKLMTLFGIGDYSAELVMPEMGVPLDVWSAKIFSILFRGKVPSDSRKSIAELKKTALERWGKWAGYVFVYVLNDLPRISKRIGFDLSSL
jgi:3-methyladenine DNA glycosylase/8-oxoguanine DNA glycosylase